MKISMKVLALVALALVSMTSLASAGGRLVTFGLTHRVYDDVAFSDDEVTASQNYRDSTATDRTVNASVNAIPNWLSPSTSLTADTTRGFEIDAPWPNEYAGVSFTSDSTVTFAKVLFRVHVVDDGNSSVLWGSADSIFVVVQATDGSANSSGTTSWKTVAVYGTNVAGYFSKGVFFDVEAKGQLASSLVTPTNTTGSFLGTTGVLYRYLTPTTVNGAPTVGWKAYRIIRIFDSDTASKRANFKTNITAYKIDECK